MKIRMKCKGTSRIGDKVRLFLSFDDIVKKSSKIGMMDALGMLGNMENIQEEIQQKALLMQQPDCVTISYGEWQNYKYKIDDIIWIEITSEDKVD